VFKEIRETRECIFFLLEDVRHVLASLGFPTLMFIKSSLLPKSAFLGPCVLEVAT
jgi:hypothetical protein